MRMTSEPHELGVALPEAALPGDLLPIYGRAPT